MGKTNQKGRSKHEPFVKLHRGVTNSPAWRALTCEARCLVLLVWERHNGINNGYIPLSHREARLALGVGNTKTARAFKQAQEHGFLIEREKGSFNWKVGAGEGRATEWELSTEPCDGKPAKRLYREWQTQNTASNAGTKGTQSGNHSNKYNAPKHRDGSHNRNRYSQLRVVSGS